MQQIDHTPSTIFFENRKVALNLQTQLIADYKITFLFVQSCCAVPVP